MRIVLAQHIDPVVIAVGRAHDRVYVKFRRLRMGEKHARVMIELDERDRARDAIVERVRLAEAADPAEMRLGEMALDLAHARREGAGWQGRDIGRHEIEQVALLSRAHLTRTQSLERNDAVVLMRATEMQMVGELPAPG